MIKSLVSFLTKPWSIPALALIGVLLHAPGLRADLFADDFLQWALLTGEVKQTPLPGSLFGLFNLVDGQPAHVQAMKDAGRLLWCAPDTLRMTFWRPLAELTHWLDYQLWPQSPTLMHAHSLAWYGLLLLALGHLYKRLTPTPIQGGLALAIFALSSLHVVAISWLSARNQLMSAFFTVGTIFFYHQWRSGRGVHHGWLCALALVLGLASAEASVAAMGYMVAHAMTIERDKTPKARLLTLLPFLAIIVIWRVLCTQTGYGSLDSGSYVDPARVPLRFAEALLVRLPAMIMAQLFGMPSSAANQMNHEQQISYAMGAAMVALAMAWLIKRLGLWKSPQVRFFALGTLLALIPVCAVAPQDRVLIHAEIGLSGVLSLLTCHIAAKMERDQRSVSRGIKWTVGTLMSVHLLLFPMLSVAGSALFGPLMGPSTYGAVATLPKEAGAPDARVVLINPPMPNLLFYYPLIRSYLGLSNPKSMWALANGPQQAIALEVLDAGTLRLSSPGEFIDMINRDLVSRPFKPGDVVKLDQLTITIETVSAQGGPLSARFQFAKPLTDHMWQFYVWRDMAYVPFQLPRPGQVVQLPAANLAKIVRESLVGRLQHHAG